MRRFSLTRKARSDLFEIWEYLADNAGLDRADQVVLGIQNAFTAIAEMPGIGHARGDLADESLRVRTVYSYLIIYRPDCTPIEVVRILHGARDVGAVIESP